MSWTECSVCRRWMKSYLLSGSTHSSSKSSTKKWTFSGTKLGWIGERSTPVMVVLGYLSPTATSARISFPSQSCCFVLHHSKPPVSIQWAPPCGVSGEAGSRQPRETCRTAVVDAGRPGVRTNKSTAVHSNVTKTSLNAAVRPSGAAAHKDGSSRVISSHLRSMAQIPVPVPVVRRCRQRHPFCSERRQSATRLTQVQHLAASLEDLLDG